MFGNDRTAMRRTFIEAWRKHREGLPADPLEAQIGAVIAQHPEYHALLEDPASLSREWLPEQGESNPFLHLSMHLSIREQVSTDRPAGIAALHRRLGERLGDVHAAEHRMLECLGESLWQAQRNNAAPDERAYLECIERV